MKGRSKQHSSEQMLSGEKTVQILSADLHRTLLRVAFHSLSPQLLAHMDQYNYPLSCHCAQRLFDAVIYLLQDVEEKLDKVDIVVKRGTINVIKYSVTLSNVLKNHVLKKLILELHDECFYVVEKAEHKASLERKNPIGVFEALRDHFPIFADRYMTQSSLFINDLVKTVLDKGEANSLWKRQVTWHADEKLLCKMAI